MFNYFRYFLYLLVLFLFTYLKLFDFLLQFLFLLLIVTNQIFIHFFFINFLRFSMLLRFIYTDLHVRSRDTSSLRLSYFLCRNFSGCESLKFFLEQSKLSTTIWKVRLFLFMLFLFIKFLYFVLNSTKHEFDLIFGLVFLIDWFLKFLHSK